MRGASVGPLVVQDEGADERVELVGEFDVDVVLPVGEDVEATIANIGELARSGMEQTDEVILGIMTRSGKK